MARNAVTVTFPSKTLTLPSITDNEITRDYNSAVVAFRAGPIVSGVELRAVMSTLQIENLPEDTTTGGVMHLLSSLGHPTTESAIRVQANEDKSLATIKDPNSFYARNVLKCFKEQIDDQDEEDFTMKLLPDDEVTGCHGSRIEMTTVHCDYSPDLRFDSRHWARESLEHQLREHGSLSWIRHSDTDKRHLTLAKFTTRDGATRAAEALHLPRSAYFRGNARLSVNLFTTIRWPVPSKIFRGLKPELDSIQKRIERGGHARLRMNFSPSKSVATLVLEGRCVKEVRQAKSAVEKLLDGTLARTDYDETAIWHPSFLTPSLLGLVANFNKSGRVYTHIDPNKAQIRLYGGSVAQQRYAAKLLTSQVRSSQSLAYRYFLPKNMAQEAAKEGALRVYERFGSAASFEWTEKSNTLFFCGAKIEEFKDAIELLRASSKKEQTKRASCVACTEPASYPIRTSCGHVYCKECFENQCNSFNLGPTLSGIICCGLSPSTFSGIPDTICTHTFTLSELRNMISSTTFESLLRSALNAHVAANIKDISFCPTPDCSQLYHPTTTGELITCSSCLALVCTGCNSPRHGSLSCEEQKDLDAGGHLAAKKFKDKLGAKDCPKCGASIEKIDGCEHVICGICKVDFCFICLESFETTGEGYDTISGGEACYRHIGMVHENSEDHVEFENNLRLHIDAMHDPA